MQQVTIALNDPQCSYVLDSCITKFKTLSNRRAQLSNHSIVAVQGFVSVHLHKPITLKSDLHLIYP